VRLFLLLLCAKCQLRGAMLSVLRCLETVRGKKWEIFCGTFCTGSLSGVRRPLFPARGTKFSTFSVW
jgi:hypothetical protein